MLFLLTMLLAGMVLSNLVEEKANKVIEILAAAIPMDAVFLGKLFAMLAISLVGIAVWTAVIGGLVGLSGFEGLFGGMIDFSTTCPRPGSAGRCSSLLGIVYFAMGYLLLGSIFLAIGSLATTVREVQTLSMPVTMMQVLLFFFATLAMSEPGKPIEWAAMAFPLSSPFAMLARAAQHEDAVAACHGDRLAARLGGAVHPLRRGAVPQAGDEVRAAGREAEPRPRRRSLPRRSADVRKMCYRVRAMTHSTTAVPRSPGLARASPCRSSPRAAAPAQAKTFRVSYTDAEWRRRLRPAPVRGAARRGHRAPVQLAARPTRSARGTFVCAGCNNELYASTHQVRQRHRLAELLPPAARRDRHLDRLQARLSAHRSALRRLRRAPGPRVQRRAHADRLALLHERAGDEVPRRLTRLRADPPDPEVAAGRAGTRLEPVERLPLDERAARPFGAAERKRATSLLSGHSAT